MIALLQTLIETLLPHMPVLAIMALFMGAFVIALLPERAEILRRIVVCLAVLSALSCILCLIGPVLLRGEILSYWMGGWKPVSGYAIGIGLEVDALSLVFALIVVVMAAASMLFSFRYISRDDAHEKYYTLFLMLCGGVLGLVLTGDLFNMYVMVEIMTFSAVALTAFRNWYHGALEAAFKYLVVSCIGSTCILIGTALLYAQLHTLNLAQIAALLDGNYTPAELLALAFLLIGYAVKAFAFPSHPIAADAHATAPSSISVMISGVLTKTGVYGIIRIGYVLFKCMNDGAIRALIVFTGCASMLVCVCMALMQHDFKRLLAFHSISQIGYILAAIGTGTALGLCGGIYHAINHALFKGLLFLCAGCVLYRTGTTDLDRLGGLARRMPHTCALFLIAAASISGIPPFNGFASKWYIYQALYDAAVQSGNIAYIAALVCALLVSVMTLASFIKVGQTVFFGPVPKHLAATREAPLSMRIPMALLAALCVLIGLFPQAMDRLFLTPATAAAFDAPGYIDAMMGQGYAQKIAANAIETVSAAHTMPGFWSPAAWLTLFAILLCAVCAVILLTRRTAFAGQQDGNHDAKYDIFFGGERSIPQTIGGGDLFFGMRRNLNGFLLPLQRAHTGSVRDYAIWTSCAMAVYIAYVLILFGR